MYTSRALRQNTEKENADTDFNRERKESIMNVTENIIHLREIKI